MENCIGKTKITIEIDPDLYIRFCEKCENEFGTTIIDEIISLIQADTSWS